MSIMLFAYFDTGREGGVKQLDVYYEGCKTLLVHDINVNKKILFYTACYSLLDVELSTDCLHIFEPFFLVLSSLRDSDGQCCDFDIIHQNALS